MNDAVQELEPLPPSPPNQATLVALTAPDRVHTLLRLQYDVSHLSEDGQKLLLHTLTNALMELEKGIKKMGKIEVAKKLSLRERVKGFQGNGT